MNDGEEIFTLNQWQQVALLLFRLLKRVADSCERNEVNCRMIAECMLNPAVPTLQEPEDFELMAKSLKVLFIERQGRIIQDDDEQRLCNILGLLPGGND